MQCSPLLQMARNNSSAVLIDMSFTCRIVSPTSKPALKAGVPIRTSNTVTPSALVQSCKSSLVPAGLAIPGCLIFYQVSEHSVILFCIKLRLQVLNVQQVRSVDLIRNRQVAR